MPRARRPLLAGDCSDYGNGECTDANIQQPCTRLGRAKQLEAVAEQPDEKRGLVDPLRKELGILVQEMQCPIAVERLILVKAKAVQHDKPQPESQH